MYAVLEHEEESLQMSRIDVAVACSGVTGEGDVADILKPLSRNEAGESAFGLVVGVEELKCVATTGSAYSHNVSVFRQCPERIYQDNFKPGCC